jgi:hypothetical protein
LQNKARSTLLSCFSTAIPTALIATVRDCAKSHKSTSIIPSTDLLTILVRHSINTKTNEKKLLDQTTQLYPSFCSVVLYSGLLYSIYQDPRNPPSATTLVPLHPQDPPRIFVPSPRPSISSKFCYPRTSPLLTKTLVTRPIFAPQMLPPDLPFTPCLTTCTSPPSAEIKVSASDSYKREENIAHHSNLAVYSLIPRSRRELTKSLLWLCKTPSIYPSPSPPLTLPTSPSPSSPASSSPRTTLLHRTIPLRHIRKISLILSICEKVAFHLRISLACCPALGR